MSYQETNGTVTLTMSRDDYERLLFALGVVVGCSSRDGLPIRDWLEFTNRINQGNPHFIPYK